MQAIIEAAIPGASKADCEYVLWARTPFPFQKMTAKVIYKAANGYWRASRRGVVLCDHCHRPALPGAYECTKCHDGLMLMRYETNRPSNQRPCKLNSRKSQH